MNTGPTKKELDEIEASMLVEEEAEDWPEYCANEPFAPCWYYNSEERTGGE